MKYAIQIGGHDVDSDCAQTGLDFIVAALAAGHGIERVFFYRDGVRWAFADDSGTPDSAAAWVRLAEQQGIPLVFCTAAAERRGLMSADAEQSRHAPLPGFQPGGLASWLDACLKADRVLVFGQT